MKRNLLTTVENVVHQPNGAPQQMLSTRSSQELSTTEQMCHRWAVATEERSALPSLWLKKCSALVIRNDAGKLGRTGKPDDPEVIEVRIGDELVSAIPPQMSIRLCFVDFSRITVRCKQGEAKYTVAAFPV